MLLVYGFPLFLANLVTGPRPQINSYLLSVYVTADLIGNYSVAMRFSALVGLIVTPISQVILPLFSKLESNLEDLKLVYQASVKYTSLLVFPIVAAIMATSPQIIQILYDQDYAQASLYMRLYLSTYFFIGIGLLSNQRLLNSRSLTRITFNSTFLQTVVTLPITFLLVQRYGVVGMLVSELVGPRIGMLYGIWEIRRNFGFIFDLRASLTLFLSSFSAFIVATFMLDALTLNLWVELVLGCAVTLLAYIIGIIVLKALTLGDLRNMSSLSDTFGPLSRVFRMFLGFLERFVDE